MNVSDAETYDEDVNDQPVDYSKKYVERNATPQNQRPADGSQASRVSKKEFEERDSKVDLFGDYAETDLDQPTDYSLRYAEDDTDEEEKQNNEYFPGSEQEDTVKTYCTEGTPYETPFNFSTATSMSDLRVEDIKENVLVKKLPKKPTEASKVPVSFIKQTEPLSCDEQSDLQTKELEEDNSKDAAVLNPGQVTPEKMVNYYEEEETSRGFSRANSLSSLSSANTPQNNVTDVMSKEDLPPPANKEVLENPDRSVARLSSNQTELSSVNDTSFENKSSPRVLDKEGKMVTFGGQDYYAEETPLMFSRCSSLGSLSGFEQYSIHDDRSSVISDFSRRTSGVVSPSELPDSPTQTVLPSPRNHKPQNAEFISKIQDEAVRPSVRHLSFSKPPATRTSVFEDDIATFKEESTPIEFSSATSLSSLTIDDEIKIPNDTKTYRTMEGTFDINEKDVHALEKDLLDLKISSSDNNVKEEQVSDGDEDDEDMLAACINMGMQTNRYRQSLNSQKSVQSESTSILVTYQRNSNPARLESHATPVKTPVGTSKSRTAMEIVASDTVHVYCTEDTPADISPVGSQSNLSALSMPSVQEDIEKIVCEQDKSVESDRNDLFDENSNLSGEDEKILDECIQSGIPKARQSTPPPTNGILFGKKSETLSHKFNKCGTPSSSPVETSHGNKNSILSPKSPGSASLRHPDEFSDDSLNHSDDDAILTECIQSAMPKARFNLSPPIRPPLVQAAENRTTINIQPSSSTSSTFYQSRYMEQKKSIVKKLLPFEDNVGLSEEEEDIMLAQCIRSGMPKASNSMPSTTMASTAKKPEPSLKTTANFPIPSASYFANKSPARNTVLYSPSLYKSTNVNAADVRFTRSVSGNFNHFPGKATSSSMAQTSGQTLKHCDNGTRDRINNSPHCTRRSPLRHTESQNGNFVDNLCMRSRDVKCGPMCNRVQNDDEYTCKTHNTVKSNTVPSRHSSASSLSEEGSLISTEEWALLELCITSGMPRSKCQVKGSKPDENAISNSHDDCEPIPEDNYSVCSYNSYICKT